MEAVQHAAQKWKHPAAAAALAKAAAQKAVGKPAEAKAAALALSVGSRVQAPRRTALVEAAAWAEAADGKNQALQQAH